MANRFLEAALEGLKQLGCTRVIVTPIYTPGIYGGEFGEHCQHCNVLAGEEHLLGCAFAAYPEEEPSRELVLRAPA